MMSRTVSACCGSWQCAPAMLQHHQQAGFATSRKQLRLPAAFTRPQRSLKVVAGGGIGDADAAPTGAASIRRRRKLFNIDAPSPSDATSSSNSSSSSATLQPPLLLLQQQQQQQQQQEVPQALTASRRRRRPTTYSSQQQQEAGQQQQQQDPGQQQQQDASHEDMQLHWWQHPSAASTLLTHIFWDLDNLKPEHWNQAPDLVESLKSALEPFGRLQQLQGYANGNTLVRQVETWGLEEEFFEEEDDTRCPICGRRCKSFEDLQKHFKQLHEREHKKKLGGPKKFVNKYVKSDKAARVRDARRLYGTPRKNRGGRTGQLVRAVLQKAGVVVYEAASQKQAADEAINRHLDRLLEKLQSSEPQPPSPAAAAPVEAGNDSETAAENDTEAQRRKWKLWLELAELRHARDCLTQMLTMSDYEFKTAWKYLKRIGATVPKQRKMWTFRRDIEAARADGSSSVKPPEWLASAWGVYHSNPHKVAEHEEQRQLLQQQTAASACQDSDESAAAAETTASLAPWDADTALQQSVLVIVSDDRGFAQSIAKWLRKGGAGAVLVTTRSRAAWERPLLTALGSSGNQRRVDDIVIVSWDDVMASAGPNVVWGDDDAEAELQWDEHLPYTDDGYLWMLSEGFL